jgi:pimeloyl-ACP methyl ester carboxylesterase
LEIRSLVNEYFRGKIERSKVQKKLDVFCKEAWFPFAYLDDALPEAPSFDKWYQEMDFDPLPIIQNVNVPVLFLYGEQDPWVPTAKSIAIWKEYGPDDLSVHQIKDANHFMKSIAQAGIRGDEGPQAEEYLTVLTQWLKQRLG